MWNAHQQSVNGGACFGPGAAPPEPPAQQFDADIYKDLFYRGMRESLRRCLNGVEAALEETLAHVGAVLDARIAEVQSPAATPDPPVADDAGVDAPPAAARDDAQAAGASAWDGGAEGRAWTVFALLRQRAALGVRSMPPAVAERATPLRPPPLDFGLRVEAVQAKAATEAPMEEKGAAGGVEGDGCGNVGVGRAEGLHSGAEESGSRPADAGRSASETVDAHEHKQATNGGW